MKHIRIILIPLLLFMLASKGFSQKHDNVWLLGHGDINPHPLADGKSLVFDFSDSLVYIDSVLRWLPSAGGINSISDVDGQLLFYTNGLRVHNAQHQIMPNGRGLSAGSAHAARQDTQMMGYSSGIGTVYDRLILPSPAQAQQYYIIHRHSLFLPGPSTNSVLLYSLVDMSLDQGRGDVLLKNQVFHNQHPRPMTTRNLTAMRHANGRDWWIVTTHREEPEIYRFLLSDTGIAGPWVQTFPELVDSQASVRIMWGSNFSEDGRHFALSYAGRLHLFDFDRCTGVLDFSRSFSPLGDNYVPVPVAVNLVFSRRAGYLYFSTGGSVQRVDLQQTTAQVQIVMDFDSFHYQNRSSPNVVGYGHLELAPDNKIYIEGLTGGFFHIIHAPDSLDCLATRRQLYFTQKYIAPHLVNMPHYRTRPLASPCPLPPPPPAPGEPVVGPPSSPVYGGQPGTGELGDTLLVGPWPGGGGQTGPSDSTGLSTQAQASASQRLRLYPNPATQLVTLVLPQGLSGQVQLHCYNSLGQLLRQTQLEASSSSLEYSLQDLAPGLYYLQLRQGEKTWTASLRVQ